MAAQNVETIIARLQRRYSISFSNCLRELADIDVPGLRKESTTKHTNSSE